MPIPSSILDHSKCTVVSTKVLKYSPIITRETTRKGIECIKRSLIKFGQVRPIVVNSRSSCVVIGNGVLRAARELGWDKITAMLVDLSESNAIDLYVTDNRAGELSKWDVGLLKLVAQSGFSGIGWSESELQLLATTDWTMPPESNGNGTDKVRNITVVSSLWGNG